jgi:DHA1 family tetracycline resistance protein-like MFS transporter
MNTHKASLTFIFITILVDVIGVGIIVPIIPALIEGLTGEGNSAAALYGGMLMLSFAAMQFIFAPVMGELSDRFGRRPILLLALFVLGIDYIFHAYAPTLGWLFVGRVLAGIPGASYTVATAYIADISTPENKAKNFGLVGAAFGVGFIIGPVIGGLVGEAWGTQAPFLVAAGLTLLNFLFGLFIVPESLPKEKRRPINFKKMIPGVSLIHLTKYKAFLGLIIAFFLANVAGQVMPSTWSFFTTEMYGFNKAEIGISLTVVGILVAIVQGGLIGVFIKKFGEIKTIMYGFILWTVGMILFAFAINEFLLYAFMAPYILGGVAGPTLQGLMSNGVPDTEQGNLQGALTSMISLTTIIGPISLTALFFFFTKPGALVYFPGISFAAGGVLLFVASIVAYYSLKKMKASKS